MKCSSPFKGFPVAVYFIIGNELFERFNFYGMLAILSVYLKGELGYSEATATAIYHTFMFTCYFCPVFGAIISDSFIGKFYTIVILSLVYASGSIVLAVGAAITALAILLTILGLILISVGTGGIKPCVVSFGGQQFPPSEDRENALGNYFATFYFSINLGSVISMNLTPMLREEVHCLGKISCYPLAFGLPAALMTLGTVLIILGYPFYVMDKPNENITLKFTGCLVSATGNSILHRDKSVKKEHFIDHADEKYEDNFRVDVRRIFSVSWLFVPVPVFWALYDQQGSRWTFQAQAMDGEIGEDLYMIKPDQIQAVNPLLILILVPSCQYILYPLLNKFHVCVTPLQRMCTGGMLAVLAFIVSAILELEVEKTYATELVAGKAQLKIGNGLDCDLTISAYTPSGDEFTQTLAKMGMWQLNDMPVSGSEDLTLNFTATCITPTTYSPPDLTITEETANFYFVVSQASEGIDVHKSEVFQDVNKSPDGNPKIGIMYMHNGATEMVLELQGDENYEVSLSPGNGSIDFKILSNTLSKYYQVFIDGEKYSTIKLRKGGVYILLLVNGQTSELVEIVPPNAVHMLWQMPQYIIISVAEVMFSISGMEFAFTQAPLTMRAIVQSIWLLTSAFGNVIVAIVAESQLFDRQMYEYLFFAGLMFVDMLIFMVICVRYKYAPATTPEATQ